MGKLRFRLWLHNLKELRIRNFHPKYIRSPASICNGSPASLPASRIKPILKCASSPKGPCFRCGSQRIAQIYPKTGSSCPELIVPPSPVNHKALDIPFPASPRRGSSSPSSPLRSTCLLNSPMSHPVFPKSPIHAGSLIVTGKSGSAVRRDDIQVSVGCGCRAAPLASSFRKAKDNTRAALTTGVESQDFDRSSIGVGSSFEENQSTKWEPGKKSWKNADGWAKCEHNGVQKLEKKGSKCESFTKNQLPASIHNGEANAWEEKFGLSTVPKVVTYKDGKKTKTAGKVPNINNRDRRMNQNGHRSSTSPSWDGTISGAPSRRFDKEYSSCTSDDNLFSSFDQGRRSLSSFASSELFCDDHVMSFDEVLKAREMRYSPSSFKQEREDLYDAAAVFLKTRSKTMRVRQEDTSSSDQDQNMRRRRRNSRMSRSYTLRKRAQLQARWRLSEQQVDWNSGCESSASSSTTSTMVGRRRSSSTNKNVMKSTRNRYSEGQLATIRATADEKSASITMKTNAIDPAVSQAGRVTDSVAVVKCSRNPLTDFRNSMVDMILEKQIYSAPDLEELLQCFLSLNSLEHHETIVRAFTEVWEKVFQDQYAASNPALQIHLS